MRNLLRFLNILIAFFMLESYAEAQNVLTAQFALASDPAVCVYTEVSFTNQSTAGNSPIASYAWNFGDGNTSTDVNPVHIYTVAGNYTVTLVVQAQNGTADSEVKTNFVTIYPKPATNFNMTSTGCTLPVGVNFANTTTGATTYQWNFGNGQSSSAQNPPQLNFTTPNNYTVTLNTSNEFGCLDSISKPLVISDYQAGISALDSICVGTTVTISDLSTAGANHYTWAFNGASPTTSSNAINFISYNNPGTFTISLTSQNTTIGCSSTATKTIVVSPLPSANFTATPTAGCAPLEVTFTNSTQQPGHTYAWSFSGGGSSTDAAPTHTYLGNGPQNATLTVTSALGCSRTITKWVTTLSSAVADFNANVTSGCPDLPVQFSDLSFGPTPITSWQWDFGNGSTYNGQFPPVQSFPIGVYDVQLIVSTAGGCVDTLVRPSYIAVGEVDSVNFTVPFGPHCAQPGPTFTGYYEISIPHTPDEVSFVWDFFDGGPGTGLTSTHQYVSDSGIFNATFTTIFRGCSLSVTLDSVVDILAPIARFAPDQSVFCMPYSFPVTVNFQDLALLGYTTDSVDMTWKFFGPQNDSLFFDNSYLDATGNGNTSYVYNDYGEYAVMQTVTNYNTGCTYETTVPIYFTNLQAGPSSLTTDSICLGQWAYVDQMSTDVVYITNYQWNLIGDTIINFPFGEYMYSQAGTHMAVLTVQNMVGCSASYQHPITVLAHPQASFTAVDNFGCAPFAITMNNSSGPTLNGVPIATTHYVFNDNNVNQTLTGAAPINHTFTQEGVYHGMLWVTDAFGCTSQIATDSFVITKPIALFDIDSVLCNHEEVELISTSTGAGNLSYSWFLNNQILGTDSLFETTFSTTSTALSTANTLSLIVQDENGCQDTLTRTVTISVPQAHANFSFSGASMNGDGVFTCPPVFANYTNQALSYGNVTQYQWNFGDGNTSVLPNPANTFVFPGDYTLTLTITDEFGCTDDTTLASYIKILGPQGDPSWIQVPDFCGQEIQFTLANQQNVTFISWNFGDSTTASDIANVTHNYTSFGTFIPIVTLQDDNNCQVIYPMDTILILENGLDAYFDVSSSHVQLGQLISVTDGSTFSPSSPIVSWMWNVTGQPTFNNNESPFNLALPSPGSYNVQLVITNDNGCVDTYQVVVNVSGDVVIPNVFTPNGDGTNDKFSLAVDIFDSYNVVILNRWGNVVCEGKNLVTVEFWDGLTQAGLESPDGVYFYKIEGILKDKKTAFSKDGFLTLIRK